MVRLVNPHRAPDWANLIAIARPSPRPAPVISATLPVNSKLIAGLQRPYPRCGKDY